MYTTLENKMGVLEAEPQQGNDMLVGCVCYVGEVCIFSSMFLMLLIVGSTGTEVKAALISYEVMHAPSSHLMFLTCHTKSLVFLMWGREWSTGGLRILAISFVTPYVTGPQLDTVGLKGLSFGRF